jgi:hypothetical protein
VFSPAPRSAYLRISALRRASVFRATHRRQIADRPTFRQPDRISTQPIRVSPRRENRCAARLPFSFVFR